MDDLGSADDQPIQTDDQDLLGRSTFAKNLTAAIVSKKQGRFGDCLDGEVEHW